MTTILQDIDVWQLDGDIYCKHSDGNLVRIQSSDPEKVLTVIRCLQAGEEAGSVEKKGISKEDFSTIAGFLYRQGLASPSFPEGKEAYHIGFSGSDPLFEYLSSELNTPRVKLHWKRVRQPADLSGIQMLLVIGPLFDRYDAIRQLSDASYRRGDPLLYASFSPTALTIGPLAVPRLDTPSLHCFMKRMVVNLKDPVQYSRFILSADKTREVEANPMKLPYLPACVNLLACELEKIILHDFTLSYHLMGKSHTMDFSLFTHQETTVLRDPLSPLFTHAPFTPFN